MSLLTYIQSIFFSVSSDITCLFKPKIRRFVKLAKRTDTFKKIAVYGWRLQEYEELRGTQIKNSYNDKRHYKKRSSITESTMPLSELSKSFPSSKSISDVIERIQDEKMYLWLEIYNVINKDPVNKHRSGLTASFLCDIENTTILFSSVGPWSE